MHAKYVIAVTFAALCFSACGNPAQEQFVRDTDAICKRVNRAFSKQLDSPETLATMHSVARQAQTELETIEAPAESARQFAQYLKVNQERIDLLGAALKHPVPHLSDDPRMRRAEALRDQSGSLAQALGFAHCS